MAKKALAVFVMWSVLALLVLGFEKPNPITWADVAVAYFVPAFIVLLVRAMVWSAGVLDNG